MNVTIVYSTQSGSTSTAAEMVAETLRESSYTVTVCSALETTKDTLSPFDVLVIGSPSWEVDGKDGQPLPEVITLLESMPKESFTNKKVAVFGLGDETYKHFCGGVDVILTKLTEKGVTPIVESLRIDRYYSSHDNQTKLVEWAQTLGKSILS